MDKQVVVFDVIVGMGIRLGRLISVQEIEQNLKGLVSKNDIKAIMQELSNNEKITLLANDYVLVKGQELQSQKNRNI